MKNTIALLTLLFIVGTASSQNKTASQLSVKHTANFEIGENDFMLNGKPYVVRCGEMHFARIPKEYWVHRLKMAKAMGLNTVCAYLFWNMHEPEPGKFNWTGMADAAEFCKLAQQEGLYVILRPGPYACAEWDFGGFPWWLLKKKDIKLRTQDPYYLERCRIYLKEVGRVLAPYQINNGGNIIMTQVENEYGSYGTDKEYLGKIRDYLKEAGFTVPLFTCDGPSQLKNDVREDIFSVVNFGGNPESAFKSLREIRPKGPLMCGEYYPGWFDSWGTKHHTGSVDNVAKEIKYMLDHKASFSIYMAHGGTTFGMWTGANSPPYLPQTSSYDYDAPISEAGWDTEKFYVLRKLFAGYLQEGETLPEVPARNKVIKIPEFATTKVAPLFSNLPDFIEDRNPQNMEEYNQGFGSILYRTTLKGGKAATLNIKEIHDYAWIFIDGKKIASLDRRKEENSCQIPATRKGAVLDILVEATGRVNYGGALHDRKGITEKVFLTDIDSKSIDLYNWKVFPIALNNNKTPDHLKFETGNTTMPAFHKGNFVLDETGDTFLNVSTWGKGLVWINGHCLGRFWNIGPTQSMYVPGSWLKKGNNEVVVLDYMGPSKNILSGMELPILDALAPSLVRTKHKKENQKLQLQNQAPAFTGKAKPSIEWQEAKFKSVNGRYVCFEALNGYQEDAPYACLAELYLFDENGKEIPRAKWKVVYADSEEIESEDGKADNVFDLQSTTYWHTQYSETEDRFPHQIVIDLGNIKSVGGMKFLPRQNSPNGQIKEYNIYISKELFKGL
ncbi:MAG: beta-galactosidase [Flavobacterium nitrogenifigens]|uniref:beta-galactosidase n=1 Tax=Flavobacterium nitrogenifigens TaxID=1617283 RepID=UPI002806B707|nr:beta-galactosidase [Flavobacterium nitrogenifigens]MDQ8013944.1 beta-galactosidase [Flavobacterium nitrogenifigens]